MDDALAQFTGITGAAPDRAQQYLTLTDNNVEQAIQLYFESDGVDMGGSLEAAPTRNSRPSQPTASGDVISIDSDDEDDDNVGGGGVSRAPNHSVEDDEAMARRMQEELYGSAGGRTGEDVAEVRAPQARTSETLLGPGADWRDDPDEMNAAIAEQMAARARMRSARPGIFNQQASPASIWTEDHDPEVRRQTLSRATAGASDASSKSNMLAEMYRPPFEIMSTLSTWEGVRAEGKEQEKWILVNVQDPNIFDCQVLNRDIWKNEQVRDTVRENFIFKQYTKTDPQAANYVRYYFQTSDSPDAYPHIAIVDPRTGEQVKVWSGTPVPKAPDFLMQLHEFLDRYSLKANSRNPVAKRKVEKRKELEVEKMTEDEMFQLAMQNSLDAQRPGIKDDDPDVLTRSIGNLDKGKRRAIAGNGDKSSSSGNDNNDTTNDNDLDMESIGGGGGVSVTEPETSTSPPSPFSQISSSNPHDEPTPDTPNTTRIQFRHPGGRVIRRFKLDEKVRRIYEWMKAAPMEGKEGVEFELVFMGKNLMDRLDESVEGAGLKNGSVMVEFV